MLKRLSLIQGTQEWLDWRSDGVGSSDLKPIIGTSQYKTIFELWLEKLGYLIPKNIGANPHIRRGNHFEPIVRDALSVHFKTEIEVFCGEDSEYPHRKVSFDGVIHGIYPVEIKCPDETQWLEFKQLKRDSTLYNEYYEQVVWQIGLLGAPYGFLAVFYHETSELIVIKVKADKGYFRRLCAAVDDFYINYILTNNEPEKDLERDLYIPTESEYQANHSIVHNLTEVLKEEQRLNKLLEEIKITKAKALRDVMDIACTYKCMNVHGLKLSKVNPKPKFNYAKYMKDKNIIISDSDKKLYSNEVKSSFRVGKSRLQDINTDIEVVMRQQKNTLSLLSFNVAI